MLSLTFIRNAAKFTTTSQISRLCVSTVAVNLTEPAKRPSNCVLIGNKIHSVQSSLHSGFCTFKPKKSKKAVPAVDHVGRLDLRIGKIVDIKPAPDSDTLYLTKVNIGEEVLAIVAGLAKLIPSDKLLNQQVVVLCNLKPSKLRGHLSEGMIMCAKANDQTEILQPPSNAVPGDLVLCDDYERVPVETPRDKKRLYDSLAPDLLTNDQLVACYKGSRLFVMDKGNISAKTLKNAHIS
ncbi:aminoacyl tRNA synthase complex-interacting multifunctional protein 1-like [Bradysia coprophila]|uniref:aminoacyl tRNA synthase complex-interacting multifunctional protein 1-like n=1 Tax=Bradysia coprophila TaxID=38358 RepID=UPI00187D7070|nr:aminoacyl tRNA synthase complex-interacting multifunctional protein 1-like [Bradysia coprophila]